MSTYVDKEGNTVAHFDREYWAKYDDFGKRQAAMYFACKGGEVKPFDAIPSKDCQEPDLEVHMVGKNTLLVDAEVKEDYDWQFIHLGAHIPARKIKMIYKYPNHLFMVCLVKGDGKQLLLVPRRALLESHNVVGHRGSSFGGHSTTNSDNYSGPGPNGADKVYKWTNRGDYEHFLEVPERWTSLIEVKETGVDYVSRRNADMREWVTDGN